MKIKTEIEMRQLRAALEKIEASYYFVDVTSHEIKELPSPLMELRLVVDGVESNVTIHINCGKSTVFAELDLLGA